MKGLFISSIPIPSMYGVFTYIWLIFMVNVGKYTIHAWYGIWISCPQEMPGFSCYHFNLPQLEAVDGGEGRACRGANENVTWRVGGVGV